MHQKCDLVGKQGRERRMEEKILNTYLLERWEYTAFINNSLFKKEHSENKENVLEIKNKVKICVLKYKLEEISWKLGIKKIGRKNELGINVGCPTYG